MFKVKELLSHRGRFHSQAADFRATFFPGPPCLHLLQTHPPSVRPEGLSSWDLALTRSLSIPGNTRLTEGTGPRSFGNLATNPGLRQRSSLPGQAHLPPSCPPTSLRGAGVLQRLPWRGEHLG